MNQMMQFYRYIDDCLKTCRFTASFNDRFKIVYKPVVFPQPYSDELTKLRQLLTKKKTMLAGECSRGDCASVGRLGPFYSSDGRTGLP